MPVITWEAGGSLFSGSFLGFTSLSNDTGRVGNGGDWHGWRDIVVQGALKPDRPGATADPDLDHSENPRLSKRAHHGRSYFFWPSGIPAGAQNAFCLWKVFVVGLAILVMLFYWFHPSLHGRHYLTDVLAGYAMGIAWFGVVYTLVEKYFLTRKVMHANKD